jgi:hypothetical protein
MWVGGGPDMFKTLTGQLFHSVQQDQVAALDSS